MVEGVEMFKYLGRTLDQTDNYWSEIRQNIMLARLVWGRLGKLLRQGGVDLNVSEMFYRAVEQEILLYVLETWFLSASMENKVEGARTGLNWVPIFVLWNFAFKVCNNTWFMPSVCNFFHPFSSVVLK